MASAGLTWWRRHAGVRLTTSLAAAAVVALALAASGLLLSVLLRRSLTSGVEAAARQRAFDLSVTLGSDGIDALASLSSRAGSSLVQILQGDRVVSSSTELAGEPAMTTLRPGPGQTMSLAPGRIGHDDEDHVVVAVGVRARGGPSYVVVVAQSLEPVNTSISALTGLLGVGMPLLVLLVGAATFLVAGRALRPVEAIRRRVAGIDAAQLGSRVPVPLARDEVGRLAETMNDMLERLESAATAQRRFVSDASHELRSPLATVRTSVEVAKAHPEISDWEAIGDIVLAETDRLQALVADLLLLARTDERGLQLRRAEVDLDDLCQTEADRLRHLGQVTVLDHIEPLRVAGDRDQLARMLRNLVDNAARYAAGRVALSCRREGAVAVVAVSDDGPGVPAAERERVFERFVRLDESRTRIGGGTGLGLAIAVQVAHAHGGQIGFVDPGPAGGSQVVVTLPLPT